MHVVKMSGMEFTALPREQCRNQLAEIRWAHGFVCPACGHDKAYQLKTRNLQECANKKCKRQTSPTAQTQFHNSRTLEKVWAFASQVPQEIILSQSLGKVKALMNVSAATARRNIERLRLSLAGRGMSIFEPENKRSIRSLDNCDTLVSVERREAPDEQRNDLWRECWLILKTIFLSQSYHRHQEHLYSNMSC